MTRCFRLMVWGMVIGLLALSWGCAPTQTYEPVGLTSYYDTAWPLSIDSTLGTIEIYQPQPLKFAGDQLRARAAVCLTRTSSTTPEFGSIWFDARVSTDRDARTVTIEDLTMRHVVFPAENGQQDTQISQWLQEQLPLMNVTFSLDQLMTSLALAQQEKVEAGELVTTPPRIIFSSTPATLVVINGEPKLGAVGQSKVMRVMNTPYILLQDPGTKEFYLDMGEMWMSAAAVTGPWKVEENVPREVVDAGAEVAGAEGSAATQPAAGQPPTGGQATGTPQVIVSEEPAELIVTQGPPTFTPLAGNELLYVNNTESNVFQDGVSHQFYVLLAGRWYEGGSLEGPWKYVAADKLPAAFGKIPADSPKGPVLAFVAGTNEAQEAKLDASVPQTAVVRRDIGNNLNVTYDGQPQFQPIQGTTMSYAVNTTFAVIEVDGMYYCCDQAVWYESESPQGPWVVCVNVPEEIYTLPPSCPIYYVRYCYVYDAYPDVAYVGYLPGYTGCYVYGSTVVYGTGYDYPGWYGNYYIPGPCTWGFGAAYDPWTGAWGFDLGFGFGFGGWYPVFVGGPWRHRWFGPGGFRGGRFGEAGRLGNHPIARNLYARPENVHRNASVENFHREVESARGANNIYAGPNGNVYRRTDSGWEENRGGAWNRTNSMPAYRSPAYGGQRGMNAEHFARERGAARSGSFGARGSGGAYHGGGGGGGGRGGGGHGGGGGGRR